MPTYFESLYPEAPRFQRGLGMLPSGWNVRRPRVHAASAPKSHAASSPFVHRATPVGIQGLGDGFTDILNTIGGGFTSALDVVLGGKAKREADAAQVELARVQAEKRAADQELVPYYVAGGVVALAVVIGGLAVISNIKATNRRPLPPATTVAGYRRRRRRK